LLLLHFFHQPTPTHNYTLSLHDALPICETMMDTEAFREFKTGLTLLRDRRAAKALPHMRRAVELDKNNPYYMSYLGVVLARSEGDRKSTRLNSSHQIISYAVFCLKKKQK